MLRYPTFTDRLRQIVFVCSDGSRQNEKRCEVINTNLFAARDDSSPTWYPTTPSRIKPLSFLSVASLAPVDIMPSIHARDAYSGINSLSSLILRVQSGGGQSLELVGVWRVCGMHIVV